MAEIHDTWSGSFSDPAIPMNTNRVWIDGCFDAMHFGHARLILEARKLGTTVVVGVHSDEEVQKVKGPVIMPLEERVRVVASCRWVSEVVPCAPYRTSRQWVDHFGCHLAAHGDDIAMDQAGQDSLAEMKNAGRFALVKRFSGPGTISTTRLIDRMLRARTDQHLPRNIFTKLVSKLSGDQPLNEEHLEPSRMLDKMRLFSRGVDDNDNCTPIFEYRVYGHPCAIEEIVKGSPPSKGQRVVYINGAFDLFTAGHVAFLEAVTSTETTLHGGSKPYIIVGLYDDRLINSHRGRSLPVMNLAERALLLLQCRYVSCVILTAPSQPSLDGFAYLHQWTIDAVYVGQVESGYLGRKSESYAKRKEAGLIMELDGVAHQDVTTEAVRRRVLDYREAFEARQRGRRGH